jgi:hypothetical protein
MNSWRFLLIIACWDVVGAERIGELGPRHLVLRGVSGSVVGPPRSCCAVKRVFCTSMQLMSPNLDLIARS